ncbi:MAG: SagB/ThcOx family dehydrogenase [Planctomycetes bacterium]|nr:SagB/ThcOx family dehydrogenase [Planctomycetota bacterium]
MNRRTFVKAVPAAAMLAAAARGPAEEAPSPAGAAPAPAGDLQPVALPKPQTDGGKSVLAALRERRTIRSLSDEKLPQQALSDLLWAAFGVNRESGPFGQAGRTAASASNSQEIDVYVLLAEGAYLYEAAPHRLAPVAAGDLRARAGGRGRGGGAARAPVNLIYVVDIDKYSRAKLQEPGLKDPEIQKMYYGAATGLIAGNVYLFAASQGLAAWFHNCDRAGLAADLKLRPAQRVLFAHTVGYPAKG